jgi:8-oxo-dGTP diphosphatase
VTEAERPLDRVGLAVAGLAAGELVVEFALAHGEAPREALLSRGWLTLEALDVVEAPGQLTMTFAVAPASSSMTTALRLARDAGITDEELAAAPRHQRAAAYGVVTSDRGLLLTELSDRTNAAGRWTLPGGGVDPGEAPLQAFSREVWEETGQAVSDVRLLDVLGSHWVGRAPSGRVEDYHAVRIVFAAVCPKPSDPVVHDMGGSTSAAAWVPWSQVASYDVVAPFAELVSSKAAQHG